MDDSHTPLPAWCKAAMVIMLALVLVLGCVTLQKAAQTNELLEHMETICGDTMVAIEMDLRSGEHVQAEDVHTYYVITRSYEESPQAMLAKLLWESELDGVSLRLTEEERIQIADGIREFYNEETTTEKLTECYHRIQNILWAS